MWSPSRTEVRSVGVSDLTPQITQLADRGFPQSRELAAGLIALDCALLHESQDRPHETLRKLHVVPGYLHNSRSLLAMPEFVDANTRLFECHDQLQSSALGHYDEAERFHLLCRARDNLSIAAGHSVRASEVLMLEDAGPISLKHVEISRGDSVSIGVRNIQDWRRKHPCAPPLAQALESLHRAITTFEERSQNEGIRLAEFSWHCLVDVQAHAVEKKWSRYYDHPHSTFRRVAKQVDSGQVALRGGDHRAARKHLFKAVEIAQLELVF